MTSSLSMLLAFMEPGPSDDQEFNEWYDLDHVPERMRLPGFLSVQRYKCLDGWPTYLCVYDLAGLGALETPEYRAVGGDNITAWTKRIMRRVRGWRRSIANQVDPGDATTPPAGHSQRMVYLELAGSPDEQQVVSAVARFGAAHPGLRQARVLRDAERATAYHVLIDFEQPVAMAMLPFDALFEEDLRVVIANAYVPIQAQYWPGN